MAECGGGNAEGAEAERATQKPQKETKKSLVFLCVLCVTSAPSAFCPRIRTPHTKQKSPEAYTSGLLSKRAETNRNKRLFLLAELAQGGNLCCHHSQFGLRHSHVKAGFGVTQGFFSLALGGVGFFFVQVLAANGGV